MKKIFYKISLVLLFPFLVFASCKKDKIEPKVDEPEEPQHPEEIITTFKFILTDSATNSIQVYFFSDPDGDGGNPAFYGPGTTAANSSQSDSVINLSANATYFGRILLLNETKNPVDTVSNEVFEEGDEHMLFYNNSNNQVLNAGVPYLVKLNGSGIEITYTDLDNGTPQRSIGLSTRIRTFDAGEKHPLQIALKHQPGVKNGTYAPGETDIEVMFRVKVN